MYLCCKCLLLSSISMYLFDVLIPCTLGIIKYLFVVCLFGFENPYKKIESHLLKSNTKSTDV